MSNPARRVRSRVAPKAGDRSPIDDFPAFEDLHDTPAKITPEDPARIAVGLLLQRALEAAGTTVEDAGRNGIVIVVLVPADTWVDLARDEWQSSARGGEVYRDGLGLHGSRWGDDSWMVWAPKELPRAASLGDAGEAFARAVAKGRHCAAFTSDLSWLPPDLVQAADHRLTLPWLRSADIGVVARALCGDDASETVSDEQAAALTPKLLRLARRLEQSADAYIRKLRELIVRGQPAAATAPIASPRDEPTLDRLHGMDEAVEWGLGVAADLKAYKAGGLPWSQVGGHGCLLSGPPGCGKTLFARALAETCGVPLVTGSYGQWLGTGHAGQGELLKGMRKAFSDAREQKPSVLFIDEVDSFPNRATITHHWADWEIQVVNALLTEIDGVEGREGVVLLAACNHPEKLDPALVRSGRLDKHIRIRLPDRAALERILREHLGADLADESLSGAALAAAGASGADCERVVRGARRRAREASRPMLLSDLMEEIGGSDSRTEAELRVVAIHEAGHAVADCEFHPGDLAAVTLRANGSDGGRTISTRRRSRHMLAADVHLRLVGLLAGRAAEEVILGEPSSGAGGAADCDLAIATQLAATAASALGLDVSAGLMWSGLPDAANLPRMLVEDPALAARVRATLDRAYGDALALVRRRRAAIEALADALVERRALDGGEAAAIAARHPGAESEDPAP